MKNIHLTLLILNLLFSALNAALLITGHIAGITVFALVLNLFAAKVSWNGYKREVAKRPNSQNTM